MTKLIKKRDKGFTTLSNEIFKHGLSIQSVGLYSYLLSLPDDWDFYIDEIATHFKNGRDAIRKALEELEKTGFIKREQTRSANGKFGSFDWLIVDTPTFSPLTEKPISVKPTSDLPISENPTLLSTNITKDLITKDVNIPPLPQEIQTDESAYSKIFDIWQQEIGQITSMVAQDVKKDIEDMKKFTTQQDAIELIEYAISEAAMNSARTPSYVFAITRKICAQQLKTVADVKARKLERQTKRDKQKFKPAKRVVEKKPNYPTQPTPVEQTVPVIETPVDDAEIESTRKAIERLKASRMPKGEL
ncbi:DnaD domain protein [Periweissella fabaria]|uniref:DnaB/C C-terminal domain-containing protein n=1 Tax=Periweissella fabaria TaxID=546157 RepID=A0ABN8BIL9_9LACO|nr:DnaD domain protein [Periweissella fabaria]MCM0596301.1 DnaD domain protein [Periweissella fabaria]CAH0415944.1 hypothetical protein WFA24289_00242 [Periweissella fabaria]